MILSKTILLTNHYSKAPYDIVKSVVPDGFHLKMLPENSQEALENSVKDADYILASGRVKITKEVLDKAVKLKMVQRTGVGLDSLDLCELRKRSIPLYVNQGVNAESVAEHTLLLMLACLRKLPVIHRNTVNGIWKKQEQGVQTYELAGKTIGLVGMGNIAQTVVRLLKPFGVKIFYFDTFRKSEKNEKDLDITYCNLNELFGKADILSLHCPLTDDTRKVVNEKSLASMKDGAILVNTARGGLIDTDAIVEALKSGKLAFAGLDVHEEEPLKDGCGIKELCNVILTPHIGGVTNDSFYRMMHYAMRNIEKYEKGELDEIAQFLYE